MFLFHSHTLSHSWTLRAARAFLILGNPPLALKSPPGVPPSILQQPRQHHSRPTLIQPLVAVFLLRCFFAHLLILQYPDHHQNLISSSLYYSRPVHKISSQSVHNFLSKLSTDKQTDRQTNQRYQKHNILCQGGNQLFSRYKSRVLLISF